MNYPEAAVAVAQALADAYKYRAFCEAVSDTAVLITLLLCVFVALPFFGAYMVRQGGK